MTTKLIAHRGDNKYFPENSYRGIKAALQAGAQYVEFDIQMTADQHFIVHHDADLNRTAKQDTSIFSNDYKQLKKFSVHEPTRFNNKHYPTPISLLTDILKLLREYPDATAFVEIKTQSLKEWGTEVVIDALLPLLAPYQKQCVLISFNSPALHYAQQKSKLKTGWVIKKHDDKTHEETKVLQPDFLISDYKKLPKNKIVWQGRWEWMLYSINEPELAFYYVQQGITYIETDDIRRLLASPLLQARKVA